MLAIKKKVKFMEIRGLCTSAKFIVDDVEYASVQQIKHLCDLDVLKGSKIRVMADVCPGIGTTIGSTFTYDDTILPSLIGSDIGCGIVAVKLSAKRIELKQLDKIIRENLVGRNKIDSIVLKHQQNVDLTKLYCKKHVDIARCYDKLGEVGGGNHFVELDRDSNGSYWLTVHSGSRLLGQQIYDYYIDKGDQHNSRIFSALTEELKDQYVHDTLIAQEFAKANRLVIIDVICKFLKTKVVEEYHSIHNYIDAKYKIARKGAISAQIGEKVVIPISASPIYGGVIIGRGKGSEEWNFSAPHGAGRICSRAESKELFTVSEFKKEMDGVYSNNINSAGISEAPMVYKRREYIQESLKDLVEIEDVLIPIFNYKS
jgi:RNA-splicing ligase RtcB